MSHVISYLKDEKGASAAEYALILAVIGAAIGTVTALLGTNIHNAINTAATCVKTPSTC
jgi:pilus assembly protein Flp/PilA